LLYQESRSEYCRCGVCSWTIILENISSTAGGGTACEEEATEGSNWVGAASGRDFAIHGSSTRGSCSSDFITVCLPNESSVLVCVRVQQNILNAENKRDKIFVDEVETL
jgi:hypothetical protein